jgi:hypothetical protein
MSGRYARPPLAAYTKSICHDGSSLCASNLFPALLARGLFSGGPRGRRNVAPWVKGGVNTPPAKRLYSLRVGFPRRLRPI